VVEGKNLPRSVHAQGVVDAMGSCTSAPAYAQNASCRHLDRRVAYLLPDSCPTSSACDGTITRGTVAASVHESARRVRQPTEMDVPRLGHPKIAGHVDDSPPQAVRPSRRSPSLNADSDAACTRPDTCLSTSFYVAPDELWPPSGSGPGRRPGTAVRAPAGAAQPPGLPLVTRPVCGPGSRCSYHGTHRPPPLSERAAGGTSAISTSGREEAVAIRRGREWSA